MLNDARDMRQLLTPSEQNSKADHTVHIMERIAKQRADNCERAKRAKATLDSGQRLATTNAKGEREIMDDARRASETQRLQDIMRSDC